MRSWSCKYSRRGHLSTRSTSRLSNSDAIHSPKVSGRTRTEIDSDRFLIPSKFCLTLLSRSDFRPSASAKALAVLASFSKPMAGI